MENTLGIRIQNARKKAGLSQEALGEKLGVSRQAVSKWESDVSIPEVDNIIAMSRILEVPVGVLLGVDEKAVGDSSDKNYEELKNILDKWSEKYSETSHTARKRGKMLLASIALFIFVVIILVSTVNGLKRKLNDTNDRISRVEQRISEQIGSMEYSIQNILEEGASLISDYDIAITAYDIDSGNYTISINAVPKEVDANAEGKFIYSLANEKTISVDAVKKDGAYSVDGWVIPMDKRANLTLVMETEGGTKTALIEKDFGVSKDAFSYEIWAYWNYDIKEYGNRTIKFNVLDGFISSNFPIRVKTPSNIIKIEAQIYLNGDKEPSFSKDISDQINKTGNDEYDSNIAVLDGCRVDSPEYDISGNDVYSVLKITEDNGNVFYRVMEAMEGGTSQMEFDDPGNTEWNPGEKYKHL